MVTFKFHWICKPRLLICVQVKPGLFCFVCSCKFVPPNDSLRSALSHIPRFLSQQMTCSLEVSEHCQVIVQTEIMLPKGAVISIDIEKTSDSVWINGLLRRLHQSKKNVKSQNCRTLDTKPTPEHTNWKREHSEFLGTKIGKPQWKVIFPIVFPFLSLTCSTG